MMRVGIIGACGHGGTAFAGKLPVRFIGAAPGTYDEPGVRALCEARKIDYYVNWRDLLPRCDAVVVNTVFSENAAIAEEALRQGLHVYAEKPAATDPAAFERLRDAAAASDRLYFSMLTLRYDPWFRTAKRLLDAGAIGQPRLVTAQKSYKLGKRPAFYADRALYGGTIPWIGIHIIDLALWMTGLSCEGVRGRHARAANGGNGSMESTATVDMTLTGGVEAQLHMDFLRPAAAPTHGDDRIRIAGDAGVLEVRDRQVRLINADHDGTVPVPNDPCEPIFDAFLTLAADPALRRDPIHAGIDAFEATRIALAARDDADAHL